MGDQEMRLGSQAEGQEMQSGVGVDLSAAMERLLSAAEMLEQTVVRLSERQSALAMDAEASVGRIVATVEGRREFELEHKLAAAEAQVAELQARAACVPVSVADGERGRKTLPASMTTLLAKQGVTIESLEAGALDAALTSLSLEQRIAVKAQLLRAGLLG